MRWDPTGETEREREREGERGKSKVMWTGREEQPSRGSSGHKGEEGRGAGGLEERRGDLCYCRTESQGTSRTRCRCRGRQVPDPVRPPG